MINKRSSLSLGNKRIFLFFIILNFIKCDLPVHCKREEIEGLWTFRIERSVFQPDLNNPKTSCGHGFPDKIEETFGDVNFSFDSFTDIEVHLGSDYKIYERDMKTVAGTWTPVYDEGFIVYYHNSVFTAFMKYFKTGTDGKAYGSNCDKTMIGWSVKDKNFPDQNWSCFFGFKSKIMKQFVKNRLVGIMKQVNTAASKTVGTSETFQSSESTNFMEMELKTDEALKFVKYDQEDLVKELNSMNMSWKANIHDEFKGLSFFELKEKLGLKKVKHSKKEETPTNENLFNMNNQPLDNTLSYPNEIPKLKNGPIDDIFLPFFNSPVADTPYTPVINGIDQDNHSDTNRSAIESHVANHISAQPPTNSDGVERDGQYEKDFNIISKYFNVENKDIDETKLPKNWDWRNIGGVNYVPEPRLQLSCGSCYIFSIVSSLESRLRILTNNKDKTEFSRQFPLSCSFYTEGCKGGYPILVSKFFNEFEIIPEKCAPYNPDNVNCANICDYNENPIKYFVTRYEYLGGFYGATNEIEMIKEIRARGPIPGNMTVPWTFSYYKSGIFSQKSTKINSGKFSKTTLFDQHLSWSSVDHSIMLVGYGEENGVKYWIGMNTWGSYWGEGGFFRILRGENECNIETMGDAARISFKPREKHHQK